MQSVEEDAHSLVRCDNIREPEPPCDGGEDPPVPRRGRQREDCGDDEANGDVHAGETAEKYCAVFVPIANRPLDEIKVRSISEVAIEHPLYWSKCGWIGGLLQGIEYAGAIFKR